MGVKQMVKFTMLNSMASTDFVQSLDIQKSLGIEVLDLKDHIFGKAITDISISEAWQAAALIESRGLSVYCLSTQLFHDHIDKGEHEFIRDHMSKINHIIEIANILKPEYIRILPAIMRQEQPGNPIDRMQKQFPWLIQQYQAAIDQISASGHRVVIENEYSSIMVSPKEILAFFELINRPGKLHFTYDVQNLWQMGTYPSLEAYRMLKPITVYFHVKGGQEDPITKQLKWKSSLEDATWPIVEITKEVIKDGISPVICLNPSHGEIRDDYDYRNLDRKDLDFMKGIAPSV
jgi:sugar phosphate isomerase/epimerase